MDCTETARLREAQKLAQRLLEASWARDTAGRQRKEGAGMFLTGRRHEQQLAVVSQAGGRSDDSCAGQGPFRGRTQGHGHVVEPSEVFLGGSAVGGPSAVFHEDDAKAEPCGCVWAFPSQAVLPRALGCVRWAARSPQWP